MGIAMVHQHFSVIGALTVWENVTLGEPGRLDGKRAIRHVTEIAERYGLDVDPLTRLDELTPVHHKRVEIIKSLRRDPPTPILNKPTPLLSVPAPTAQSGTFRKALPHSGLAGGLIITTP